MDAFCSARIFNTWAVLFPLSHTFSDSGKLWGKSPLPGLLTSKRLVLCRTCSWHRSLVKIRSTTEGFREGTTRGFSCIPAVDFIKFQWILPNGSIVTQMTSVRFSGSQNKAKKTSVWMCDRDTWGEVGKRRRKRRREMWEAECSISVESIELSKDKFNKSYKKERRGKKSKGTGASVEEWTRYSWRWRTKHKSVGGRPGSY